VQKTRILFVDDDENILSALQRTLRPMSAEWEVACATSGAEALKILEERPIDIVVSDMRMAGMNGDELLREVRIRYPSLVRISFSGQMDEELAAGTVHRILPKPIDGETLKLTMSWACDLRRSFLANAAQ
jgi:DNA-binding NtrC family response regulator